MRNVRKTLSWLLVLVMMLSMLPSAAFAAGNETYPDIGISADATEVQLVKDHDGTYDASAAVDVTGVDGFNSYIMHFDMTSLDDTGEGDTHNYVASYDIIPNDAMQAMLDASTNKNWLHTPGSLYIPGDASVTGKAAVIFATSVSGQNASNLNDILKLDIKLSNDVKPGRYAIKFILADLSKSDVALLGEDESDWPTATAILVVKDADGNVPDGPDPITYYNIVSRVASGDSQLSGVEFYVDGELASKAEAGKVVTVKLIPGTGHELDTAEGKGMTLVDANGNAIELSHKAGGDANEYTFVMPESNVDFTVYYRVIQGVVDPGDETYSISIGETEHGTVELVGSDKVIAGTTVTLKVKPDEGYKTGEIKVVNAVGETVTVTKSGETQDGSELYTFDMPAGNATVTGTFVDDGGTKPDPGIDVEKGKIVVYGTVRTNHNRALGNATVTLTATNGGATATTYTVTTGGDGKFQLPAVAGNFNYTLQASYDTGVQKGVKQTPGFVVYSESKSISASMNATNEGKAISEDLTITLYYDWDLDKESGDERVYAGEDDQFLTGDDFYQKTVGGKLVNVIADEGGDIQSAKAYYFWNVDNNPTVLTKVYVGDDVTAGTTDDYYLYDVDHDPKTNDLRVFIGADRTPGTSDDYYDYDVNNDGSADRVFAGADGVIATEDDWYKAHKDSDEPVVYAGEDKVAGTADDYYWFNADGHDDNEKVFVGTDLWPSGTNGIASIDDYYKRDVNNDGTEEDLFIGADGKFNTADDYYETDIKGIGTSGQPGATVTVKVYPGATGDESDPYEFGRTNDHFDWKVGGKDVIVRVGEDRTAGTTDDEFDYEIENADGSKATVVVHVGDDAIAGTGDDWYLYNADGKDAEDEKVCCGTDGIPGTADDYYEKDVNGDGRNETVYAGEDKRFNTEDDHYPSIVDGTEIDVKAGEDKHIGTADDHFSWDLNRGKEPAVIVDVFVGEDTKPGTSDDHFAFDIKTDVKNEDGTYTETTVTVDVIAGEGGVAGNDNNYYMFDADGDGEDEQVFCGEDGIPGTGDDHYTKDVNADGEAETVYAGDDGKFKTEDDYFNDGIQVGEDKAPIVVYAGEDRTIGTADDTYKWDLDRDPDTTDDVVDMFVGDDRDPGTEDDYYLHDVNGDGTPEKILAGEDKIPGTEKDHYFFDADQDGELENVFVGGDKTPGTKDDYYDKDVNADGEPERVYAGEDEKFHTPDDFYNATVNTPDGDKAIVPVYAGKDGEFSDPKSDPASDDWYPWDTNKDGNIDPDIYDGTDTHDKVFIDGDSLAGTDDDYYYKDVTGDGEPDQIFVGKDGMPHTPDDYYNVDIDGDGKDETVTAGPDGIIGNKDDIYDFDVDHNPETPDVPVHVGDDGIAGTDDDWYEKDIDKDGFPEKIYAGEDGIPGTKDDVYPFEIGGIKDVPVNVGPDGIPGTEDDNYDWTKDNGPDGIPGTEDDEILHVTIGPDGIPGTKDDVYPYDVDNNPETPDVPVRVGEDGIPGTEDDEYDSDPDKDGDDEVIYVGPDKDPGNNDDWWYGELTFDAGEGTVNGSRYYKTISSKLVSLPTASRSSYTFNGWLLDGNRVALSDVQNLKNRNVTLTASYSYNAPYYPGSGGGANIRDPQTPLGDRLTITFMSNGGSTVAAQTVERDKTVTKPADPTREGFAFNGWYTDPGCTAAYDFNTKVTQSFNLYAGWTSANAVFDLLTGEHITYVLGYDDGLVHPNNEITRAEAAMIFYRLLKDDVRAKYETNKTVFSDVPSNAWYATAVNTLANMKIVEGIGNGKYAPANNMTRAEFATICARIGELNATKPCSFPDVEKTHWAYSYICAASENGWIYGYDTGKFGPNDNITRAQVVTLLNRVLNRDKVDADSYSKFSGQAGFRNWTDNVAGSWYYFDMIEAGNGHTNSVDSDGMEVWDSLTGR